MYFSNTHATGNCSICPQSRIPARKPPLTAPHDSEATRANPNFAWSARITVHRPTVRGNFLRLLDCWELDLFLGIDTRWHLVSSEESKRRARICSRWPVDLCGKQCRRRGYCLRLRRGLWLCPRRAVCRSPCSVGITFSKWARGPSRRLNNPLRRLLKDSDDPGPGGVAQGRKRRSWATLRPGSGLSALVSPLWSFPVLLIRFRFPPVFTLKGSFSDSDLPIFRIFTGSTGTTICFRFFLLVLNTCNGLAVRYIETGSHLAVRYINAAIHLAVRYMPNR